MKRQKMNEFINIKNGYFYYEDNLALNDINLKMKENEKLVLLGNNGSGKSTILRILAGLYFFKKR